MTLHSCSQYQELATELRQTLPTTVGAVLHQIVNNKPRPIAFFSKTLQLAERNYQIYDKEFLVMMLALQKWWQFLRNGPEFDVWSDHQNLTYFREPQKLSRQQARWAAELAEFNLKLHHRPGKLNIIADILSRTYSPEGGGGGGGVKSSNVDQILLKPELFDIIQDQPEVQDHTQCIGYTNVDETMGRIRKL